MVQARGDALSMLRTQKRWRLADLEVGTVLTFYRQALNVCLPRSLLRNVDFEIKNIPVAYPTVKEKCFKGDPAKKWKKKDM